MAHLALHLLGSPRLVRDGESVRISRHKVMALVAYLAIERRPHQREALATFLWPELDASSARTDLRRTLSLVNSALGGDAVIADRETVQLNPDLALASDVDAFHRALAACETHAHPAAETCAECVPLLEEAIALYQDDFLAGFTLEDSAAFDEWQFFQTQALHDQATAALNRLVQWYATQGESDFDQAIGYARRWLALDPLQEPAHRYLMALYARTGQRSAALRQYHACARILQEELGTAPSEETTALYERIRDGGMVDALPALGALTPAPRPGTSPFKGLQFFDVGDAALFFGREALTERLVRTITAGAPFLAVVGASGSGKSSVVRAGLVARLLAGESGQDWGVRILTPTAEPLQALAYAVAAEGASADTVARCIEALLADPHVLGRWLRGDGASPDDPTAAIPNAPSPRHELLVVDQFEELFTLCRDRTKRHAFIAALLATASTPSPAGASTPVHVVIALRADFYHRCGEYEGLRQALEAHQVFVGAMTADELRRAIVAPAEAGGWTFEPGLVALLLHDVGADAQRSPEPGALPLLSHALLETWKHRQATTLTLKGYAEAGGVRGAIARSAESVYRTLDPAEQAIARAIFLRLTELGEVTDGAGSVPYTRRRAAVSEVLHERTDRLTVQSVLDTLARARLVTMERDALEVAHEALIREWPTLRSWLEEDREGLRMHRHLTEAAQAWANRNRDPAELYRGARLAQAREWSAAHPEMLNALEREFLEASNAGEAHAEVEREAQRQRELEAAQQVARSESRRSAERGRLLRWIGVAAALLLVAAVAAALLGAQYRTTSRENATLADVNATTAAQNAAVAAENAAIAATAQASQAEAIAAREQEARQRAAAEAAEDEAAAQRDAAQLQARINLANSLAGEAILQGEKTSELSLLLALEANRLRDVPQTRNALLSALEQSPGRVRYLVAEPTTWLNSVAVTPDGETLLSSTSVEIALWDPGTGEPIGEPLSGFAGAVQAATFAGGGDLIAVFLGPDGTGSGAQVELYKRENQDTAWQRAAVITSSCTIGTCLMDVSADGRFLAAGGCEESEAIGQSWICTRAGASSWDLSVLMEGGSEPALVAQVSLPGEAWNLAISPDGAAVALSGCGAFGTGTLSCTAPLVALWSPATGEIASHAEDAFADTELVCVNDIAFTTDGGTLAMAGGRSGDALASGCDKSWAELWDVSSLTRQAHINSEQDPGFFSLAISPDGGTIALGAEDTINLWAPSSGGIKDPPMIGHHAEVADLAFSPDGQTLFSAGQDQRIGAWDLRLPGGIRTQLAAYPDGLSQPSFSPDGTTIAVGLVDGIDLRDAVTGQLVGAIRHGQDFAQFYDVEFSPDGTMLATADAANGTVQLWNVASRSALCPPLLLAPGEPAYDVAFSPDGKTLASSGGGLDIVLWDVESMIAGTPLSRTLSGHTSGVPQVTFSPDGTLLASAGHDGTARLWDVASGRHIGEPMTATLAWSVAFSPDGRVLATGTQSEVITLWDVASQSQIGLPLESNQGIWRLAFTPDGSTLAAIDDVGVLHLWDLSLEGGTARPYGESMSGHKFRACGMDVSRDGQTAVTTAYSGELQLWQIDPVWWRERACAITARNLTQAEWAQYLPGETYHVTCAAWPAGD